MNIVVYTKPACMACHLTKKELARLGLAFQVRDVSSDDEAAAEARRLGAEHGLALPIVTVTDSGCLDQCWAGFKIDRIRGLAS